MFQKISDFKDQCRLEEEDNFLIFHTDFETIGIQITEKLKYCTSHKFLIRFINDEYLEEIPCDNSISPIYFLPSHIEGLFESYFEEECYISEIKDYYPEELRENFKEINIWINFDKVITEEQQNYSTSFYGLLKEDGYEEELLKVALEIKKQFNAMKDYQIAIGQMKENYGILEQGRKKKTNNPSSKHFNFWKFKREQSNITFLDISSEFKIINDVGELYASNSTR